ncbi:MarR family winged helix-turn-helix transcriptional regulator [Williamsia herbipolensis]|uniref:MarR family transcriptional regulator n=1 Tax=Williamsia herbipolensis TaxID=1603258 RepID=A0AAU4K0Z1_9NOCA|nr:MarR family transcriptional regulator [Williamsia herbipolensis]MCX6469094.1 MarR family transcriptional regulator [Mycobacteriales bacterium]
MADPTPEDPTRWLDTDELESWMALTTVMIRLPAALGRQLQRDSGLTHFEYQVLAGLSQAPDRTLRMSDLAVVTEGQLPRLSQVTARMEKRGWLTRATDPSDGRFTLASLTDDGMQVLVDAAPGHVEAVRRLVFDPLTSAQIRQLREIGRRLRSSLDDEDR